MNEMPDNSMNGRADLPKYYKDFLQQYLFYHARVGIMPTRPEIKGAWVLQKGKTVTIEDLLIGGRYTSPALWPIISASPAN